MRWIVSSVLFVLSLPTACAGGEALIVHLRDGRAATGALDSATDSSRLWVNVSEGGIALRSGFAWSDIRTVVHESRRLPADEFRNLVSQLASSKPALMDNLNPATAAVHEVIAATEAPLVTPAAFTETAPPPVRSLRVRAWSANWDDDPELDGVLVEVTPLGPRGEFVAVDGLLSMTLIGEHSRGNPEDLRTFRQRYPEISRGSERVHAEHFWSGPAVYKLPYRNLFPEAQLDLFPQGVLTATLGSRVRGTSLRRPMPSRSFRPVRSAIAASNGSAVATSPRNSPACATRAASASTAKCATRRSARRRRGTTDNTDETDKSEGNGRSIESPTFPYPCYPCYPWFPLFLSSAFL